MHTWPRRVIFPTVAPVGDGDHGAPGVASPLRRSSSPTTPSRVLPTSEPPEWCLTPWEAF